MKGKLDLTNRTALEFNRNNAEAMRKICAPLEKFGVTYFTYVRFFNGGKRLYVTTNLKWIDFYLQNNFQDVLEHVGHYVPRDNIRYSLWTSFIRNKVFESMHEFNHWNGFTIYEKHEGYVDYFDFTSDKQHVNIANFYLNNLELLESFVKDFKQKASDIIEPNDEKKLIVPKHQIIFDDIKHISFVEEDKIKKFMEEIKFKPHLNS